MQMAEGLMVSPASGSPFSPSPASSTYSCCLCPSLGTETLPAQPPSEEQSETWNSIRFKGENNVGGTQMSTGTSLHCNNSLGMVWEC